MHDADGAMVALDQVSASFAKTGKTYGAKLHGTHRIPTGQAMPYPQGNSILSPRRDFPAPQGTKLS
jgi:hypothetical protein